MASVMVGTVGKFMSATHMGITSKPSLGGLGAVAPFCQAIHRDGVPPVPVNNAGKIVFHSVRRAAPASFCPMAA